MTDEEIVANAFTDVLRANASLEKRLLGFEHFTASVLAENNPYFYELADRWLETEDYDRIMEALNDD